ncbi:MAG: hypothetical protein ACI9K2_004002 [Myxococcota bacterium]|jgi:hypothetical protein
MAAARADVVAAQAGLICGTWEHAHAVEATVSDIDPSLRTELEAAAFRRLVQHLRDHPEAQNIDLMNLAGFCRNCLSRWYDEAAAANGVQLGKAAAREIVYGMPYSEWKAQHQTPASPEQQAAFRERDPSAG